MNTKHQGKYIKTPAPAQLKKIKLRDTFEKNDSTRYWQAG